MTWFSKRENRLIVVDDIEPKGHLIMYDKSKKLTKKLIKKKNKKKNKALKSRK
jgi:hypothetical protein